MKFNNVGSLERALRSGNNGNVSEERFMRRSWSWTGLLCLCLLTGVAHSEDVASDGATVTSGHSPTGMTSAGSTPSLTPDQELELLKQKPEEYRTLVLGTQIFLGRFGYGVGPFTGEADQTTKRALREYQRDAGLPETGELDYRTLKRLTDDNKTLDQAIPFLPQYAFTNQNDHVVSAQGTWARENLPVHEALQTSDFTCRRQFNVCIDSTAGLSPGHTQSLLVRTQYFEIDSWDEKIIATKPTQTGPCAITVVRIDREDKTVVRSTSVKREPDGPCAAAPTFNRQFQLADGAQIYRALKRQKLKDTRKILRVTEPAHSIPQRQD